jgi:hypothetical protein
MLVDALADAGAADHVVERLATFKACPKGQHWPPEVDY